MTVFVAALDWGLGHATRIVPIIMQQIKAGNKVIIGASKNQISIYKEHFPNIEVIIMPSAPPVYSKRRFQLLTYIMYTPKFLFLIKKEHKILKNIVKKYDIEKVFSDNCYGLYHENTINIIITHQINLQIPKLFKPIQFAVNLYIKKKINQFDECHIPDNLPPHNFSGNLSFPIKSFLCKTKFIGIQSRLSCVDDIVLESYPELVILISGPERQRSVFEKIIVNSLLKLQNKYSYLIIRGLPNSTENSIKNSVNHLDAPLLKAYLVNAKYIIARSGYSTIMDLAYLGKQAFLIPTPNQTEQEYLAHYLNKKGRFFSSSQSKFDLERALNCLATHF